MSRRQSLFRRFSKLISSDSFGDRSALGWLVDLFTFPFRFAVAFAGFLVSAWPTSRNGVAFLLGLPALLSMAGFWSLIWGANYLTSLKKQVARCQGYIQMHQEKNPDHPEYARLFAQRWLNFRPEEQLAKFQLAVCEEACDNQFRAQQIYDTLTQHEDQNLNGELDEGEDLNGNGELDSGFGRAHLQVGNRFFQGVNTTLSEEERFKEARKHFLIAQQTGEDDVKTLSHLSLGRLCLAEGDKRGAAEEFGAMLPNPRMLVQIQIIPEWIRLKRELFATERDEANLLDDSQRDEELREIRNKDQDMVVFTRGIIEDSLALARRSGVFEIWQTLVQCAELLEDRDKANDLMQLAEELNSDAEFKRRLKLLRSRVYMARSQKFKEDWDTKPGFTNFLIATYRSIWANPGNAQAIKQLLKLIVSGEEQQVLWLRENQLLEGVPATLVKITFGFLEIHEGNTGAAQSEWLNAKSADPNSRVIISGMFDVILTDPELDLNNMQDAVALALQVFPQDSSLEMTKGIFLAKNRRIDAAINSLEFGLQAQAEHLFGRRMLIECYAQKGDMTQKKIHEDLFNEVLAAGYSSKDQQRIRDRMNELVSGMSQAD